MKKQILFIALAASLAAGTLQAQDTLWMKPAPMGNYFSNSWIDTSATITTTTIRPSRCHLLARQFVANEGNLEVYGIAAMMINPDSFYFSPSSYYPTVQSYLDLYYPNDPSFDRCEESLLLFQYHGSPTPTMQQLGDSLPVHILHTPVSYYFMSNTPPVGPEDMLRKPVYERYFSTPQTVHDTFFLGSTMGGGFTKEDTIIWHHFRPEFNCLGFRHSYNETVAAIRQDRYGAPNVWDFYSNWECAYFIFPILTPAPDTTVNPGDTIINPGDTIINPGDTIVNPGDTLAIRTNDILYRYTALQPNPASNKVKVLSSFGISRIEAYDLKGRKVSEFRTPNSEFKVTLDVSSWPRGTYLLRITTPAGQTTKKLLLR